MAIKTVEVMIQGTRALLQNRFNETTEEESKQDTRRVKLQHLPPREQAERSCYRAKDGTLTHPGAAIARLLREAGTNHKMKGSRKSVKFIVPSAVLVLEEWLPLLGEDGAALTTFEVDARSVVIPSTKGRVMKYRPRYETWKSTFHLEVNEELLSLDLVHQLLVEGGMQLGLGDFRLEKGGPFGRFIVTGWALLEVKP